MRHLDYPANVMPSNSQLQVSAISPLIIQSEIRSMSVECDRVGGINLAQGICDTDVPPQYAADLMAKLRSGDVQTILVKQGDHRLSRGQDLDLLIETVSNLVD